MFSLHLILEQDKIEIFFNHSNIRVIQLHK